MNTVNQAELRADIVEQFENQADHNAEQNPLPGALSTYRRQHNTDCQKQHR